MSTRMHIVVSDELVARIDEEKGIASRSAWVRSVLEAMLVPTESRSAARGVKDPYRCPREGCESRYDKPGFKCTKHGEKLVLA